jgi:NADH dehydrogenase [ubiquinone] 1 alpha subcomplex assembly factor 7
VNALGRIIAQRIRLQGPISLAAFMADALGHPEHGYYRRADPFGQAGDFITAPEISQMFGELIGLWCAEVWRLMGAPDAFRLVELGPGRGTLMADALRAAEVLPGFATAAAVHFVETSPLLRARQKAARVGGTVSWHGSIGDVPAGPTILVANEFFDALPVHQFERTPGGWRERLVALDDDSFALVTAPAPTPAEVLIPEAIRLSAPDGAVVEVSPAAISTARAIAERLEAEGGAALIIDYGHTAHGVGETLQAVRRHKYHDILADPGEADLTAHVDFAALADAARPHVAIHGPVTQGAFLKDLGIEIRARQLSQRATEGQRQDIESALHRLIDPAEMGTLFKVLAMSDRGLAPPPGLENDVGRPTPGQDDHG